MKGKLSLADFHAEGWSIDRRSGRAVQGIKPRPMLPKKALPTFTTKDVNYIKTEDRVEFTLPIDLYNQNDGQSKHWSKANKRRNGYETILRSLGLIKAVAPNFKQRITVIRILGKGQKLWDWANFGFSTKELQDALVATRWLFDDKPQYLDKPVYEQDETDRENGFKTRIILEKL